MSDSKTSTGIHICILLVGFSLTILPNLGSRDLWEPEELRYAEVSREIGQTGEWALLHLNGIPYPDKPPLFFWMICASAKCFGGFHAAAVRAPNITSAFLLIFALYFFGRRLIGARAALLACVVLMATPFFVWTCAEARMDTTLTLFITLALWCGKRNYEGGGRNIPLHLLFGLLTGLAVLTKGPVGILLPVLVLLVYAVQEKQLRRVLNLPFLLAIAAALAVILPWLLISAVKGGGEFSWNLIITQNVGRVTHGVRHTQPFYHFFKVVPGILAPWTLFLPAMLYYPVVEREERLKRGLRFAFCWFLTVFVFFTLVKAKRTIYMTPLLPAAGLLLGAALDKFLTGESSDCPRRGMRWLLGILIAAALAFSCAAPILLSVMPILVRKVPVLTKLMGPAYERFPDYFTLAAIVSSVVAVGAVVCAVLYARRRRAASLWVLFGTMWVSWFLASVLILPAVNREKSARILLSHIERIVDREHEPLSIFSSERTGYAVYWGKSIPLLGMRETRGREGEELKQYLSTPSRVFCLARQDQFPEEFLSVADNGWIVWRDSCGYREHILISNQIRNVPEEEARLFQQGHPDARAHEMPGLTLLVSGGTPKAAEDADAEIDCSGGRLLLKLFPAKRDRVVPVRLKLRGMNADDARVSALSLGRAGSPVEHEAVPHSSPMMCTLFLQEPCTVLIEKTEQGKESEPCQESRFLRRK